MDFKAFPMKFNIKCNIILNYKVSKTMPNAWLFEIKQFVHQNTISVVSDIYSYNIECFV